MEVLLHSMEHNLSHGLIISMFVFVTMLLVDYLNMLTAGRVSLFLTHKRWRQYVISSFLGAMPGCLGAFLSSSFYVHGLISFGAITGAMVAASGDDALVMVALFPRTALLVFLLLFVLGVVYAALVDFAAPRLGIVPCAECSLSTIHAAREKLPRLSLSDLLNNIKNISFVRFLLVGLLVVFQYAFASGAVGGQEGAWEGAVLLILTGMALLILLSVPDRYLEEHVWEHMVKKHLGKVFLLTFGTLVLVESGLALFDLAGFVREHMLWVLALAALTGVIPQSGPHMVFIFMFSKGVVPFSVLLASSIVQDGHGMLPLLSYSFKDSLLIKMFNLALGLAVGYGLLVMGY